MNKRLFYVAVIALYCSIALCGGLGAVLLAAESMPARSPAYELSAGFPRGEAAARSRDEADFQRAVTAYRFWYPTVSCEGIANGGRDLGVKVNQSIMLLTANPRHVGFTLNSDTPYGGGVLNLSVGPFVIELPPGFYVGLVNDHHQRWLADLGLTGPDGGRGGRHLILPPGYEGDVPSGYHVSRSTTFRVLVALRALPIGGNARLALESLRRIGIYPYSTASQPECLPFIDLSNQPMDSSCLRWEQRIDFWRVLHDAIEVEPIDDEFLPMYGLLAALGIEKGRPFAPDARMRGILERAARAGRDQLLVAAFASERPERMAWPDRRWEWIGLVTDNANFRTASGLDLSARERWFAQAIVASPVMFRRAQGSGSLYWLGHRDRRGEYLDGGRRYTLTVPQPVPARLFWSVTAYDAATRSQVQAPQNKAVLSSLYDKLPGNGGSVTLHFGPEPPADEAAHWIQTVPGRNWFAYFRIYGPTAAAFDGTWKPGDFERAN